MKNSVAGEISIVGLLKKENWNLNASIVILHSFLSKNAKLLHSELVDFHEYAVISRILHNMNAPQFYFF